MIFFYRTEAKEFKIHRLNITSRFYLFISTLTTTLNHLQTKLSIKLPSIFQLVSSLSMPSSFTSTSRLFSYPFLIQFFFFHLIIFTFYSSFLFQLFFFFFKLFHFIFFRLIRFYLVFKFIPFSYYFFFIHLLQLSFTSLVFILHLCFFFLIFLSTK